MNKLNLEQSPYLLQHAGNPVHWQPYSKEVLEEAKQTGKIIFISIGYSSCHWCHVMARESFEDKNTAEFMNTNLISIKIDREELPGVDKVYQEFFQISNKRGGGWPLSVWLTPNAKPIFIGTYFPKVSKHGLPSFKEINMKIIDLWRKKPDEISKHASELNLNLGRYQKLLLKKSNSSDENLLKHGIKRLKKNLDHKNGGIGRAPKFPRIQALRLLLNYGFKEKDEDLIDFVHSTFKKISNGGIYDQIGGGYARYSVDEKWLVPHFEKMLYDNALFLLLGSEIFSVRKDRRIKQKLDLTIKWLLNSMKDENSKCFYASLNAESEGVEGKFYVWRIEEIEKVTGSDFDLASEYYGVTKEGNFRDPHQPNVVGLNILTENYDLSRNHQKYNISKEEFNEKVEAIRKKLFLERKKRIKPDLDDKIITSWNSLLILGLLKYAEAFNDISIGEQALASLKFILNTVVSEKNVLRYHKTNARKINGVLDDYAFLIQACINAYEYTGEHFYLIKSSEIQDLCTNQFYDKEKGLLYYTDSTQEIGRTLQIMDESIPSALAISIMNLFKLGKYLGKKEFTLLGEELIKNASPFVRNYPESSTSLLISSLYYNEHLTEIVSLGGSELLKKIQQLYQPIKLIYRKGKSSRINNLEIFEGKDLIEEETIFICKGNTCHLPITKKNFDLSDLEKLIL